MSRGTPDPRHTPFWLRLSVVIGGFALLLGLVGAVMLVVKGDDPEPDWGPGFRPHLRLTGMDDEDLGALQVSVTWWEDESDAQVRQDAEAVTGAAGSFRLPPDAFGRTVELEVLRDRVLLLRRTATVRRGETVTVQLAQAAEGPVDDGGGEDAPPR